MKYITRAGAWGNGEVAYIAWDVEKKITDCLGFMVTRVHETGGDAGKRRILPTWIAFSDQNNPNWNEQDSSVWPIQSFEWRDLTLRKSRDTTAVRPIDFRVHYEIVPVALAKPGDTPLPPSPTAPAKDGRGLPSYEGAKHPLVAMGPPIRTNSIDVTHDCGPKIKAAFTNGILSTQNLVRQLQSVRKGPTKAVLADAASKDSTKRAKGAHEKEAHLLSVLKSEIKTKGSSIRNFLRGDVYAFLSALIDRAEVEGGQVYFALYELDDVELVPLLVDAMKRKLVHVILSTASSFDPNPKGTPKDQRKPIVWDVENDAARALLKAAAGKEKTRIIDRMFNSTARIGHNKFAVYVKDETPVAVLTGSTNWTSNGMCAQSNNSIIIEDDGLAADYFGYWQRLKDDKQPARKSVTVKTGRKTIKGAAPNAAKQGKKIRTANEKKPDPHKIGSSAARAWFSPNTQQTSVPKNNPVRPVDLDEVYGRMNAAKQAVLFLVFMPGRAGVNNIVGQAATIAASENVGKSNGESLRFANRLATIADKGRFVMGAISDPSAMPDYKAPEKGSSAKGKIKLPPPAIWWPQGDQSKIALIRASAVRIPFGNMRPELLSAGHAIIHDKIIVIDPLDAKNCTVITGSHNLGYKASYCNDENMLIVTGNRELAISYAVHVIDLYDHYVMRARLEEKIRKDIMDGKLTSYEEAAAHATPHGLLPLDDNWQDGRLAHRKQSSTAYFLADVK